jgi:periplasmic divalent cation tolerance protein
MITVTSSLGTLVHPAKLRFRDAHMRSNAIVEITTTVDSETQANELSRKLLDSKLAACIQVSGPIQSHYCWKGKVCESTEYRCVIKTVPAKQQGTIDYLAAEHPYDVPEILVVVKDANAAYETWAREQTA